MHCDVAAISRFLADEYTQISSTGRIVENADVLATLETGTRRRDEARADGLRIGVYGDTAVVVGRLRARGVNAVSVFD